VADLLALYDHDERFAATAPDLRREELPDLVRHVDLIGHTGTIIYSQLSTETADAAIKDQIAYFGSLGQDLEWKAYAHDTPADLIDRLISHGFSIDETETIMVVDLRYPPPIVQLATPSLVVKRLQRSDDLGDVASIRRRVDGEDRLDLVNRLAHEMTHDPDCISIYVAYVDETPAACGWIRFPGARAFASLWGGSTMPELRRRGLYTALLTARLREANDRGVRYVTVDARSTSRPILEKHGFQVLTHATACIWTR